MRERSEQTETKLCIRMPFLSLSLSVSPERYVSRDTGFTKNQNCISHGSYFDECATVYREHRSQLIETGFWGWRKRDGQPGFGQGWGTRLHGSSTTDSRSLHRESKLSLVSSQAKQTHQEEGREPQGEGDRERQFETNQIVYFLKQHEVPVYSSEQDLYTGDWREVLTKRVSRNLYNKANIHIYYIYIKQNQR